MPAYPALDTLEVEERTGNGVAIVVEGQTYEDDPWFYGRWFGGRAQQVTFFPQDGWPQVFAAVARLRADGCRVPVYGIVDRDFCEDEALDADFATCGILRTPRYTIENYLLEPECWAQVLKLAFSRQGQAPDGWNGTTMVANHIQFAYHECLPIAAHNRVVQFAQEHYNCSASSRVYLMHPAAAMAQDLSLELREWGRTLAAEVDFGALFDDRRRELETDDLALWQKHVSGKAVLWAFHEHLPSVKRRYDLDHYLNLYMDRCPDPPADLTALVDRILQAAGR